MRLEGYGWRPIAQHIRDKYNCKISHVAVKGWFDEPKQTSKQQIKAHPARKAAKAVDKAADQIAAKSEALTTKQPPPKDKPPDREPDLRADLQRLNEDQVMHTNRITEIAARHKEDEDEQSEIVVRRIAADMSAVAIKSAHTLTQAGVLEFAPGIDADATREWAVQLAMGKVPLHPDWNLLPHQELILREQAPYLVVHGGVGTRKSSACILKLLLHCHAYPGQVIIVAAKTYGQLDFVFMAEWKRLVPAHIYNYNEKKQMITIPGCNSELRLAHEGRPDSWEKIHGSNTSGIYGIQPETWLQRAFFEETDQRVRIFSDESRDPRYLRLFDCNAGAPDHFIHETLIDHTSAKYIGDRDFTTETPCRDTTIERDGIVTRIHIPTTAYNSAYGQAKIDQYEKTLPQSRFQRLVQGLWVAVTGRVYDHVAITDKPITPDEIRQFWIAFDPGTKRDEDDSNSGNLGVVVIAEMNAGGFAVVDERLAGYKGNQAFLTMINSLADKWGRAKLQYIVKDWHGGSGVPLADVLRKAGYTVHQPASGAAKSKWFKISPGVMLLYEAFKSERLKVSKACEKVQKDLRLYTYGEKGDDPDKNVHDAHLLDALRYGWIRIGRHNLDD